MANLIEEEAEAGRTTMTEEEEPAIRDTTKIKKVKVDKINISKIIIEEGAEEVVVEEAMMDKKRENTMASEIQVLEDRIHSSGTSSQKNLQVQTTTSKSCRKKEPSTTIISSNITVDTKVEEEEAIAAETETKAIIRAEAEVNSVGEANTVEEAVAEEEELNTNSATGTTKRMYPITISSRRGKMILQIIKAQTKKSTNISRLEHEATSLLNKTESD